MNVENIKKVRDLIAGLKPKKFNMNQWATHTESDSTRNPHTCGTVACIGGWTNAIFLPKDAGTLELSNEAAAGDFLGLDDLDAHNLFYPHVLDKDWEDVKPAEAVAVLDHLLATGEVDWSIINDPA